MTRGTCGHDPGEGRQFPSCIECKRRLLGEIWLVAGFLTQPQPQYIFMTLTPWGPTRKTGSPPP